LCHPFFSHSIPRELSKGSAAAIAARATAPAQILRTSQAGGVCTCIFARKINFTGPPHPPSRIASKGSTKDEIFFTIYRILRLDVKDLGSSRIE